MKNRNIGAFLNEHPSDSKPKGNNQDTNAKIVTHIMCGLFKYQGCFFKGLIYMRNEANVTRDKQTCFDEIAQKMKAKVTT